MMKYWNSEKGWCDVSAMPPAEWALYNQRSVYEVDRLIDPIIARCYRQNTFLKALKWESHEKIKVYISGPMSGIPNLNFKAFFRAQLELEEEGLEVVNPAEVDADVLSQRRSRTWKECIEDDLELIEGCHAIYMLKGWENSQGARLELAKAIRLGLGVRLA